MSHLQVTWETNNKLRKAIAVPLNRGTEKWLRVATSIANKTVDQLKHHYKLIVEFKARPTKDSQLPKTHKKHMKVTFQSLIKMTRGRLI